ncbi:MAG: trigger factor [Ruminococcaceae bacterium]|nr:trigger factor [Oscillospiraceae bacterium]
MQFTYRGLKATMDRHIVTEEEIDRQLQRLQQQTPRIAPVKDRPTQLGDEVVLDYAGFCDGEQFAGGTAEKQTLVLGSGAFIPGFEEQLVDKIPGEKVTVKVTFPKEYHAPNLAGKDAEFRCVIHEIRIRSTYELDDVFAQEVGKCQTLEEMRRELGKSLQNYADQRGEMDLQDRLLRQAAETLDFTPTDAQIEAELDNQMQNLSAQLARQGLDLKMYCSFLGTTEEALRSDTRNDALAAVKMQAAIEQIVALENLEPTQEELGQAAALVARQNNLTIEQLKPYYDAEFEQALIRSILTSKVMRLIRDAADVAVV